MIPSVQKIVDRISEVFSIFDFSYFISGTTTYLIVCYGLWQYDLLQWPGTKLISIPISFLFAYLCGLITFAIGKLLRKCYVRYCLGKSMDDRFRTCFHAVVQYVREEEPRLRECATIADCKLYYTEMWSFLRQCEKAGATVAFINRYWVMQAVYEGLAASFLMGGVLGVILCSTKISFLSILIVITSFISFFFSCREGSRYADTQICEIVIAYKTFKFQ